MNMMSNKIVFIRAFNYIKTYQPYPVTPPLGIASLISYLKDMKVDIEVDFFDTAIDKEYKSNIISKYKSQSPLLFCVSSMIIHLDIVQGICKFLHTEFPDTPIIIGGPLVSSLQEKIFDYINADYGVYNEGEIPLYLFIKELLSGKKRFNTIPSLIYKSDSKIIKNPDTEAILTSDEIPLPDLTAIRFDRYFSYLAFTLFIGRRAYLPIMTSRGCPFSCMYCHNIFGRSVRKIPNEKIIKYSSELISRLDIKEVEIYDDIFNADETRAKEIINQILNIKRDINFIFPNGLRTDILSESFINFLITNNTKYLSIAVESGSERIQRLIRKRLDLKAVRDNTIKLSRSKILLHGFFMLGFPTETEEEINMTINYALDLPIHTASFFKLSPHPGTDIFNLLSKTQRDHILKNLHTLRYYSPQTNISNVSDERLNILHRNALLKFYLRPKQIFKIIKDVPFSGLVDGFNIFSHILTKRYNE